jgi:hypothetical protein
VQVPKALKDCCNKMVTYFELIYCIRPNTTIFELLATLRRHPDLLYEVVKPAEWSFGAPMAACNGKVRQKVFSPAPSTITQNSNY